MLKQDYARPATSRNNSTQLENIEGFLTHLLAALVGFSIGCSIVSLMWL